MTTVPISLHKLFKGQAKFIKQNGFEVLLVSADGPEVNEVIDFEGVSHQIIPLTRTISPIKDLIALMKAIRLIKAYQPDIVHTNTPKASLIGMLAAWFCGVQVRLCGVGGLPLVESSGFKRKILEAVETFTYRCSTLVLPNSNELKNMILELGFTHPQKLKVLGEGSSNGIDLDYFHPDHLLPSQINALRGELGISNGDFVFLFVGRVVKDKGISELIDSFKKLSAEYPNTKLLVVGPLEQDLNPLSAQELKFLSSHSGVCYAGYQEDIRPYLALSDLFVFPSYREGFPNVVMQAGAFGLPCIVSNINGSNEIIQHLQNGFIVPPKSQEALFDQMKDCLNRPDAIEKMGTKARQMIADRYDQKVMHQLILAEYQNQLSHV